jgi:L-asparaginase II
MSSSHSGEPGHIETVRGILKRYGLDEGLFRCGQHYPYYEKAIWEYGHNNVPISTINNNCTGKHTAMLLAVQERGWDFNSYLNGDHPLQIENTRRMARMSGQKFDQMNWGVDGCSVPTWWQSVKECAVAYARFSSVKYPQDEEREPIQRIFDGFHKAGWHTAGTGRFGVDFNNESGGNWLGKIGGEGIFGVGIRNRGIGITVKVEDGNSRAIPPALLYVMKKCDLIDAEKLESLKKWDSVERPNAAERLIGYIRVME